MNDIKTLIENYTPNEHAKDVVRNTKVVFIVGITGAGKDTIKYELLKNDNFTRIISHTTRKIRNYESEDVEYHFISFDKAINMLNKNEFIEAKFVHTDNVYGTSIDEFIKIQKMNKTAVADIDVQGVSEYLKITDKIKIIFLIPPSYDIWIDRLNSRYDNKNQFNTEWPNRRKSAINEIDIALKNDNFNFILNESIDDTVDEILRVIDENNPSEINDEDARIVARDILIKIK